MATVVGYVEKEKARIAKLQEHVPTEFNRGRVNALAGYGFTGDQIAADMNINKTTLYKYYKQEMQTAHIKANALVAQSLFKKATNADNDKGSVAAAIFWMKTRAGWREVQPATPAEAKENAVKILLIPGDDKL